MATNIYCVCIMISIMLIGFNLLGNTRALNAQEKDVDKILAQIQDLGMVIWTQLDLAKAINATEQDKEHFVQELDQAFLDFSQAIKTHAYSMPQDYAASLAELINALLIALQEVFIETKSSLFEKHSALLEAALKELKNTKLHQPLLYPL